MPKWTEKQREYLDNANKRWNFKIGATRSGKTFTDFEHLIPYRIRQVADKDGLVFIMGVTKNTIERNVLQPMRKKFGERLVSQISSDNTAKLFGETCYCLGAEKVNQISKIQGAGVKYCYGDEVPKWNQEVFEMLKSRLDKSYSKFDGTGNPEHPSHYLKKFLDSDINLYHQQYCIDDNTFLDEFFKEQLKKEYLGTVYYDRYILGRWTQAEGSIYPQFVTNPEKFFMPSKMVSKLMEVTVGLDFGGNKSGHAFVGTGTTFNYERLIALKSKKYMNKDYTNGITSTMIQKWSIEFIREIKEKYGRCDYFEWDNESVVLGNDVKQAINKEFPEVTVRPCYKATIKERIELKVKLIGQERYFYTEDCETLVQATKEAVYDKSKLEDERLDDFTSDIDTLDAEEYTFTRNIYRFIRKG